MKERDITILIGNVVDKFDTSLYGFLAPLLGPIFFPGHTPIVQLMYVYAVSITSLCARPCGAFLFGIYARKRGPALSLFYSLCGVACATTMIGLLPTYHVLGSLAPLLLLIIRFIRGLCAAGESAVAKLYIMEGKTQQQALHASYWYQGSTLIGVIIASISSTFIMQYFPGAWRWCFILGGIVILGTLYIRMKNIPSINPVFASDSICYNMGIMWRERYNVLKVALVAGCSCITYFVPFTFMNNFVPLITDISLFTMMKYNTYLLFFDMIAIFTVGYFLNSSIPERVMRYASIIISVSIVPLFYYLPGSSLLYVLCVRMWIVVWGVVFLCPMNFWFKQLFSSSDSYFLVGVASALGTGVYGHTTTPLCLWLWYMTEAAYAPAMYIAVMMLCAVFVLPAKKTVTLNHSLSK